MEDTNSKKEFDASLKDLSKMGIIRVETDGTDENTQIGITHKVGDEFIKHMKHPRIFKQVVSSPDGLEMAVAGWCADKVIKSSLGNNEFYTDDDMMAMSKTLFAIIMTTIRDKQ